MLPMLPMLPRRTLHSLVFALLAPLALVASTPAHAKLHIVATTAPLGALARAVGGDDVDVAVLAASSEDPHFVEPKPSLILSLNRADIVVQNGLELEVGWLPKLITQARNPKLHVIDTSSLVTLLGVPQGKVDRAMGDVHAGGNPHFLVDARRGAQLARSIGERLASLDDAAAARHRARAQSVAEELDALADKMRARAAALPIEKRNVVAYHRSLTYLLDWLTLAEVATVEPVPGVPPNPSHVALVLQTMKGKGVKVLLQEEFYPKSTSQTLAQLSGAKLVVLSGGPRDGESYVQWVSRSAEEVLRALGA
jgi:zinc/manganese transport system substrate-binding protein